MRGERWAGALLVAGVVALTACSSDDDARRGSSSGSTPPPSVLGEVIERDDDTTTTVETTTTAEAAASTTTTSPPVATTVATTATTAPRPAYQSVVEVSENRLGYDRDAEGAYAVTSGRTVAPGENNPIEFVLAGGFPKDDIATVRITIRNRTDHDVRLPGGVRIVVHIDGPGETDHVIADPSRTVIQPGEALIAELELGFSGEGHWDISANCQLERAV